MDFQGARVKTLSILYKKQDYLITKKTFFTTLSLRSLVQT